MVKKFDREVAGKEKQQLGASLVEFTLLVALVAMVTVTSVRRMGTTLSDKLDQASIQLRSGAGGLPSCNSSHPAYPSC